MNAPRRALLIVAVPWSRLLAVLAGCGVSIDNASQSGGPGPLEQKTAKVAAETGILPPRPAGEIRLDGVAPGSLPASC